MALVAGSSSLPVQNPFSRQNTTHLVDAAPAGKELNPQFLHLSSFHMLQVVVKAGSIPGCLLEQESS